MCTGRGVAPLHQRPPRGAVCGRDPQAGEGFPVRGRARRRWVMEGKITIF